jgi:hypothetical protein
MKQSPSREANSRLSNKISFLLGNPKVNQSTKDPPLDVILTHVNLV